MRRIHPGLLALVVSVAAVAGLSYVIRQQSTPKNVEPSNEPLVVWVAEALRGPMEPLAKQYQEERGQAVELRYGASQQILTQMKLTKKGDVFLPADDSYVEEAKKKGLTAEVMPIASMTAVLVASPTFSRKIEKLDDVLKPGVKWIIANPDAAAVSKLVRAHLSKTGQWDRLMKLQPTMQGNVGQVAQAITIGTGDVGIVWDAVAKHFPKTKPVPIPEFDSVRGQVQVAVTSFAANPQNALDFAKFVAAKDKGQAIFAEHGFRTSAVADKMAEQPPEIVVYAGSMLRPAIETTLVEFAERENCRITRVYNGCGILVSQMKAGSVPDVYVACDTQFMKQVQEHFEPAAVLSSNQLVIAVPKENPFEVATLRDLGKSELKLGVGHEQQCALGALTETAFLKVGVAARLSKNIAVRSPTGDLLINQLRTGALDAVVCYRSNVMPYEKELDAIPIEIDESSCTQPEQPVAISKTTEHPQLVRRLMHALQTPESKKRFLEYGFTWKATP